MRLLMMIASLAALGYGGWWYNNTHPELNLVGKVEDLINSGHFHTLEIRYTAKQIMETHRKELLKDERHKFLDSVLNFYPYLLLEVKYTRSDERTEEGMLLWDMADGEIVIDTTDWDKTHGFGDCINADTQRNEFKIINTLAKKGGSIDREGLFKALNVENEILDTWIDSCRRKGLIVQAGNRYRLHLQNPRLKTTPQTKIDELLVTKPFKNAIRSPRRFSLTQIQRIAKAAFGQDFLIRKTTDVYLPVHSIVVQNPDGSIHTSHWNALNGKRLSQSHFID